MAQTPEQRHAWRKTLKGKAAVSRWAKNFRKRHPKPKHFRRMRVRNIGIPTAFYRAVVLKLLGGKCSCGFKDMRALQIDHVNGDGAKERHRSNAHYRRVIASINKGELRYQLLCANCNWIKRYVSHETGYKVA